MEKEANDFAAALLMPANDIRPYFNGRKIDLALLAALKPEWKVAMAALLVRASSLEFLTKNQSQYLWKQISARRLRLREPPELDFAPEYPTVVVSMLRLHKDSLGYSMLELAQLLHVHEAELYEMYPLDEPDPDRPRIAIMK